MAIKPTSDWLWVVVDDGELSGEKVIGGVIIPGDNKAVGGVVVGTVKGVGPGKYCGNEFVPTQIPNGSRVVFTKTIALQNSIEYNDVKYILVREENIIGILTDDNVQS